MEGWIDRLAETLGEEPLSPGETTEILSAAREVAHRVERRITPLAAFLIGAAVGRATSAGASREEAIRTALGTSNALLPPAAPAG